jgi:hypothetical protein
MTGTSTEASGFVQSPNAEEEYDEIITSFASESVSPSASYTIDYY